MKSLFFFPILLFGGFFSGRYFDPQFIDPTGTYTLTGVVKKNRILTHSGEIRVVLLSSEKIALSFYINAGYPDYASGSLLDTLNYNENVASYSPSNDSSCSVIFRFTGKAVEILQLYSNPHSGCGFPKGVLTSTIFEKTSEDRPILVKR